MSGERLVAEISVGLAGALAGFLSGRIIIGHVRGRLGLRLVLRTGCPSPSDAGWVAVPSCDASDVENGLWTVSSDGKIFCWGPGQGRVIEAGRAGRRFFALVVRQVEAREERQARWEAGGRGA